MLSEFKRIKKEGYGVIHAHKLGAFIVLPLKANCELASRLGLKEHNKALKKIKTIAKKKVKKKKR
ncbi:hypothetical protein HN695_07720 [Candidatus Woesearchaeota archaeon]|jgi:hypothetical protein|nr:hypothetical protein [Candidatus Woesearchaeota archaeon]MBT5272440.1 hypothetical protein [Candidatus Woesearchaeota archaeon]MBT6041218.1 hypothetical protein [Candidatus Woesearchaeota archaeon]MBT6337494.1 hypothetical protein [Candidatus Woesearchaeota archaeon]MBT7928193.1 hypothetical protein [Candidatus Woesearchaeota archaeon]